jgi:hypothetical protein
MKKLQMITVAIMLGMAGLTKAQNVPTLINYQGQLVDASGAALTNGNYSLTVRIYSADPGGTLLWGPQLLPNVPLVGGRFNVVLGPYDASFRVISTAFSNATAYLEIQVGANSPIVPRQQILSAPYALKSGAADSATDSAHLEGFGWDAVFTDTGRPDTGHLPTSKIADGAVTTAKIAVDAVGTTQVTNGAITVAKLNLQGGNVGIGPATSGYGLDVSSTNTAAIRAINTTGSGTRVVLLAEAGDAIYANGNVIVSGQLTKSSGTFRIDHPLDPANKYLSHSFVESPDMKNVYDGLVVLDASGQAEVELPDWFDALNKEFRYQLTAIGAPGPNLYVSREIAHNRFRIAGGARGLKVSWQVTGIRHDAYANAHRTPVEEEKPAQVRGYYLNPEEHGQPAEKSELSVLHPELASQQK